MPTDSEREEIQQQSTAFLNQAKRSALLTLQADGLRIVYSEADREALCQLFDASPPPRLLPGIRKRWFMAFGGRR